MYLDHVGKDTFYVCWPRCGAGFFRDADLAEFYCADNGRDSVPPSLLATALLLQSTTRSATPRPRPERTSTSAGK